jgi:acetylornithine deacetylase/succinyl-diaminopimelate desuccinylase-like protein
MIATAEKGMCWLKISRHGPAGHGSMPHGNNALEKMIQALSRLISVKLSISMSPVVEAYFTELGKGLDMFKPYLEDGNTGTLLKILTETGMDSIPQISAMIRNTISVDMMNAGTSPNVIPDNAVAHMDIRLLPGQDAGEMIRYVQDNLGDDEIGMESSQVHLSTESPRDTESYHIIRDLLEREFPDGIIAPLLTAASSDSRFFRDRGIPSYGVNPVLIPMSHMGMIHGVDEKISVRNLIRGTEIYTGLVRELCT